MYEEYKAIRITVEELEGNVFPLLMRIEKAMRQLNAPELHIDKFTDEATSGDNDHLQATVREWFTVIED